MEQNQEMVRIAPMLWPREYLDYLLDSGPRTLACESDVQASALRFALIKRRRKRSLSGIQIALRGDQIHIKKVNLPLEINRSPTNV